MRICVPFRVYMPLPSRLLRVTSLAFPSWASCDSEPDPACLSRVGITPAPFGSGLELALNFRQRGGGVREKRLQATASHGTCARVVFEGGMSGSMVASSLSVDGGCH